MIFAAQSRLHEGQRQMTTERVVNMFAEPNGEDIALRSCPGLLNRVQLGDGEIRTLLSTGDRIYACVGGFLVYWDGSSVTTVGPVRDGISTMAVNATGHIGIAAGGSFYIYDGTNLSRVTGGAFDNVGSVDFVDGYFVMHEDGGQRHQVTGIEDGDSIDALDFASAEHKPDVLRRVMVQRGFTWMMGSTTIEPWENAGGADYPLVRLSSTVLEKGLWRTEAAAKLDNTIFWHGHDHKAYRAENFDPVRISTTAIEASLDAHRLTTAFPYQYQGHDFFVIRFADRPAWIYDPMTQLWHERSEGVDYGAWNAVASVYHDGTWYAGTRDGYLCTFQGYEDQGGTLRREATSGNVTQGSSRFTITMADFRVESGTAATAQFQFSRDGGRHFGPVRYRSVGAVGNYDQRVQFHNLGMQREICARVACTDNADFAIYGADFK